MWQVLLAAAVAGSVTLLVQQFLSRDRKEKEEQSPPPPPQASINGFCSVFADSDESGRDQHGEEVFRFSSSDDTNRKVNRMVRKRYGRLLKFGGDNHYADNRSGNSEGNPKRFSVFLKKRRTAKFVPSKCGPRPSKDGSLLGWTLGAGIMYMMSAGKAEISKLRTTMDEISKDVQELRNELCKRKSSQMDAGSNNLSSQNKKLLHHESGTVHRDIKISVVSMTDEIECPSSVLTEEPDSQVLEMDQLEAELETELQKLPWCGEYFGHERLGEDMAEGKNTSQYYGVLASELDQKLCHLLIEQQENQIKELQSELHSAQSKLKEKEAELQALKDCVRRLTEFSLSNVSDDEAEIQSEQDNFSERDNNSNIRESEYAPRVSTVGMKRSVKST